MLCSGARKYSLRGRQASDLHYRKLGRGRNGQNIEEMRMKNRGCYNSRHFAPPPHFMCEKDPSHLGSDEPTVTDVGRWRRAERTRLIEARLMIPARQRRAWGVQIASHIKKQLGKSDGRVISAYWPFRGEPDLRCFMKTLAKEGQCIALPVVTNRRNVLIFRQWKMGSRLKRGVLNIPVPEDGVEVVPDVVIAPVVAFDRKKYRLGYGGGYFDRTLIAMNKSPYIIGVGYSVSEVRTIYPQVYDVPMDAIITEQGVP